MTQPTCRPNRILFVIDNLCIFLVMIAVMVCLSFMVSSVHASEGGSSNYTPGTYGDFAMNIIPPGLSVRENLIYFDGELNDYPVSYYAEDFDITVGVEPDFDLEMRFSLLQVVYGFDFKILGGRYFYNINIPFAFDAALRVNAVTDVGNFEAHDDSAGLGDIQFVPFGLAWDLDNFHILLAENIVAPTGDYNPHELVSIGRNYWAYETVVGMTWLHPTRGHEISFSAAYAINSQNSKTEYKTGDEFHVDYNVAQYFSESFAIGVAGYYYTQMGDDEGNGYDESEAMFPGLLTTKDDIKGLRAHGAGIGPAIMWGPKIGGKTLNIIFRSMNDFNCTNRFSGIWYNLSMAMSF